MNTRKEVEVVNLLGGQQTDVVGRTTHAAALLLATAIQQGQALNLGPADIVLALAAAQMMVSANFGVCTCKNCAPALSDEASVIASQLQLNDVAVQ